LIMYEQPQLVTFHAKLLLDGTVSLGFDSLEKR